MDDLVQVASLGLVKAVDRWEPERGYAFSSYAVPTILGEIRRHFRDASWIVRPPRDLLELSLVVERVRDPLVTAVGREPTVADLAERVGRSPEAVSAALQASACRSARSLDGPSHRDEEDGATIGELIGADDGEYDRVESSLTFERMASVLDQRARDILRLRFDDDLLQCQIAERIGLSQMQVSRIIRASLDRIFAFGCAGRLGWSAMETTEGALP
jgi:RNA polymerase sigma-B factor